jgi:hypothetical protein
MFGKDGVFALMLWAMVAVGMHMAACTPTATRVEIPVAPVASPTSTQAPLQGSELERGPRSEAEPDIPFDGGRPEVLVVPPSPQTEGQESSARKQDIYSELLGQTLSCEESKL